MMRLRLRLMLTLRCVLLLLHLRTMRAPIQAGLLVGVVVPVVKVRTQTGKKEKGKTSRNMKQQRKILSTRLGKEKRSRQKKKKEEEMEDKKDEEMEDKKKKEIENKKGKGMRKFTGKQTHRREYE
ncbi:DNA ligase 1 [Eurytemora carolleeae]|uniref:DNA ligase 1 n=1 Tax=Eurytemora carolleeae TaxID=1294199 RepID=UPI000C788398|nr:DNA ligase 1 [Eurytemora carolleeae]|eukprot:XP_023336828.1 DNA ligase 1-like [Eurytemora affinis]